MEIDEIYKFKDHFIPIYQNGIEINPIPTDKSVTVYCSGNDEFEDGFLIDIKESEMGIEKFIAKSWIYHSDLQKLLERE